HYENASGVETRDTLAFSVRLDVIPGEVDVFPVVGGSDVVGPLTLSGVFDARLKVHPGYQGDERTILLNTTLHGDRSFLRDGRTTGNGCRERLVIVRLRWRDGCDDRGTVGFHHFWGHLETVERRRCERECERGDGRQHSHTYTLKLKNERDDCERPDGHQPTPAVEAGGDCRPGEECDARRHGEEEYEPAVPVLFLAELLFCCVG